MGTFNTTKIIETNLKNLEPVSAHVTQHFTQKGYAVEARQEPCGCFISITKGGIFKAVLGLKTALNVTLRTTERGVLVEASVGIFGQQLVPSLIMYFVAWPVLLTQISGLISQAKLDDETIAVIEQAIREAEQQTTMATCSTEVNVGATIYCTQCGTQLVAGAKFCSDCGQKQG